MRDQSSESSLRLSLKVWSCKDDKWKLNINARTAVGELAMCSPSWLLGADEEADVGKGTGPEPKAGAGTGPEEGLISTL